MKNIAKEISFSSETITPQLLMYSKGTEVHLL